MRPVYNSVGSVKLMRLTTSHSLYGGGDLYWAYWNLNFVRNWQVTLGASKGKVVVAVVFVGTALLAAVPAVVAGDVDDDDDDDVIDDVSSSDDLIIFSCGYVPPSSNHRSMTYTRVHNRRARLHRNASWTDKSPMTISDKRTVECLPETTKLEYKLYRPIAYHGTHPA